MRHAAESRAVDPGPDVDLLVDRIFTLENEVKVVFEMMEQLQVQFTDLRNRVESSPSGPAFGDGVPPQGGGKPHAKSAADASDSRAGGDGTAPGAGDVGPGVSHKNKPKEAESVKIPNIPQAPAFRNWKSAVREEVVAASGYPEQGFAWISEVEASGAKIDDFAGSGWFPSLDAKLCAGFVESSDRRAFEANQC